ncbi:hypothetical protein SynPROS91_01412 [Synechococcus sp. PROS-9-1]|nr:hypothetical protein SynPROS91_01412 [Synechococcus sp. PROS-9-1]
MKPPRAIWDVSQAPRSVSDRSANADRHTPSDSVNVTLINQRGNSLLVIAPS